MEVLVLSVVVVVVVVFMVLVVLVVLVYWYMDVLLVVVVLVVLVVVVVVLEICCLPHLRPSFEAKKLAASPLMAAIAGLEGDIGHPLSRLVSSVGLVHITSIKKRVTITGVVCMLHRHKY